LPSAAIHPLQPVPHAFASPMATKNAMGGGSDGLDAVGFTIGGLAAGCTCAADTPPHIPTSPARTIGSRRCVVIIPTLTDARRDLMIAKHVSINRHTNKIACFRNPLFPKSGAGKLLGNMGCVHDRFVPRVPCVDAPWRNFCVDNLRRAPGCTIAAHLAFAVKRSNIMLGALGMRAGAYWWEGKPSDCSEGPRGSAWGFWQASTCMTRCEWITSPWTTCTDFGGYSHHAHR
jgi:hypothetical protein